MKTSVLTIDCLIRFLTAVLCGCKESYEPAVSKANKNFLVAEGVINTNLNSVTIIKLSRTPNTNPSEPVLGHVSATAVAEKRIFIDVRDLPGWQRIFLPTEDCYCYVQTIGTNPDNFLRYDFADATFAPCYYSGMCCLIIAKKYCPACTLAGGTNVKAAYW